MQVEELDLTNDKDVIIVKQKAYITYLEFELSKINLENGKMSSEIEYLENKIKRLNKELNSFKDKKSLQMLQEALRKRNIEINLLKKQISENSNGANIGKGFYEKEFFSLEIDTNNQF